MEIFKDPDKVPQLINNMASHLPKGGEYEAEEQNGGDSSCTICDGAGVVHPIRSDGKADFSRVRPCICAKAKVEESKRLSFLNGCELPAGTEHMTLENYKVIDNVQPSLDGSPAVTWSNKAALQAAQDMIDGKLDWLTLVGGTDRGKTHLGVAVCRTFLARGIPAIYTFVPSMLEDIRQGYGKRDMEKRFSKYLTVPLLMLDDLGTENDTAWVQEKLDIIVNKRVDNPELKLIVTTNLRANQLPPRIASRLQRHPNSRVVVVTSGEYRLGGK